jgi:DNA-binding NarL/FixJ family response regulator
MAAYQRDIEMIRVRLLCRDLCGLSGVGLGLASNGVEAIALALAERPDVMLMDIRMPEMNGLEATRRLGADARTASCKVLILTTFDLDEYVFEALRLGASGFLLKDTKRDQLIDAVRVVAQGDSLLAPTVTRRLIAELDRQPALDRSKIRLLDAITDREREVLQAVARAGPGAPDGTARSSPRRL